jgi:hypothetical protein
MRTVYESDLLDAAQEAMDTSTEYLRDDEHRLAVLGDCDDDGDWEDMPGDAGGETHVRGRGRPRKFRF